MGRLTHRYTDGEAWASIYKISAYGEDECTGPIIDRLAAYEDTGLEPEEVKQLVEDVELRFLNYVEKRYGISVGRFLDVMNAEQDGRLVILPCKAGDTVWAITSPVNVPGMDSDEEQLAIFECSVESTSLYASMVTQFRLYYHGEFVAWYVTASDFGKTVFLTREEAEAALEERQNGKGEA